MKRRKRLTPAQADLKLYEVAKEITLEAGFPYTDPRTGETTQPPKKKKPTEEKQ